MGVSQGQPQATTTPNEVLLRIPCFMGTGHITVTNTVVRLETSGVAGIGKKDIAIGRNAITGVRKRKMTLSLFGTYPAYQVWVDGMGGQRIYAHGCYGRDVNALMRVLGYR